MNNNKGNGKPKNKQVKTKKHAAVSTKKVTSKKEKESIGQAERKAIAVGIILLAVIIMIVIVICLVMTKKDNAVEDTANTLPIEEAIVFEPVNQIKSDKLLLDKIDGNIKIKEMKLKEAQNTIRIQAKVENMGEEIPAGQVLKLVFLNELGEEISFVEVTLPVLAKGVSTDISIDTLADIKNANDYKIVRGKI